MPERKITSDHDTIRRWAEERGGKPTTVRGTGGAEKVGVLRIDFPGYRTDKLEEITWDEFFAKFEEKKLAVLYQEKTQDGRLSRFFKLVKREGAQLRPPRQRPAEEGLGMRPMPAQERRRTPRSPAELRLAEEERMRWEGESPAAALEPEAGCGEEPAPALAAAPAPGKAKARGNGHAKKPNGHARKGDGEAGEPAPEEAGGPPPEAETPVPQAPLEPPEPPASQAID